MAVDKETRRKQLNEARKRRYWLKKKRKQCTKDGCYERTDGRIRCDKHYKSNSVFSSRWRKRPRNRNRINRNRREQLSVRVAIGLCARCGARDLASPRHCQKCLDYFSSLYKGPRKVRCTVCNEIGHNRRRCPKKISHEINTEEYALSRMPVTLPD